MQTVTPAPDRGRLGFVDSVEREFAFLGDYGFTCVAREPTLVRFESDRGFVSIYHGRSSYEVGVEIGRLGVRPRRRGSDESGRYVGHHTEEEPIRLWDIARFAGASGIGENTFLQASSAEGVAAAVTQLASLVQQYGGPALSGDESYFENLLLWRSEDARRAREAAELGQARKAAAIAWKQGDHRQVVRLLASFADKLTPAERKKLNYSEARTSS